MPEGKKCQCRKKIHRLLYTGVDIEDTVRQHNHQRWNNWQNVANPQIGKKQRSNKEYCGIAEKDPFLLKPFASKGPGQKDNQHGREHAIKVLWIVVLSGKKNSQR